MSVRVQARWSRTYRVALVVAPVLATACASGSSGGARAAIVDRPALPRLAFDLPLIDGGRLNAETLRGSYVVLKPFAAWCAPCKSELPRLVEPSKQFRGERVAFVAVSFDEDVSATRKLAEELRLPFPVVLDERAGLAPALGLGALSVLYLFGPDGEPLLRYEHCSREAVDQLVRTLKQRLSERVISDTTLPPTQDASAAAPSEVRK